MALPRITPVRRLARWTSLLVLVAGACAPDIPATDTEPKSYEATGTIVTVEESYVLIDHEPIEGLMDAMTMTFPVSDPSLSSGLEPGDRVTFRVLVDGASYTIDRIDVTESR